MVNRALVAFSKGRPAVADIENLVNDLKYRPNKGNFDIYNN
jgi:hypothetical protein